MAGYFPFQQVTEEIVESAAANLVKRLNLVLDANEGPIGTKYFFKGKMF